MMGALAGTAGAALALGFGELMDGAFQSIPSLVVAVSELLSDYTPGDVVAFSIANIGTSQKTLLTASIIVGSLVLGGLLGRFAARGQQRMTVAGFALFGLLGGWAAARNPLSPALGSWVVALAAAALAAGATLLLVSRAARRPVPADAAEPARTGPIGTSRRPGDIRRADDDPAGLLRLRGGCRRGRAGHGRPGAVPAGPVAGRAVPSYEHPEVSHHDSASRVHNRAERGT